MTRATTPLQEAADNRRERMQHILVAARERIVGRTRNGSEWQSFTTTPAGSLECLAINQDTTDRIWCGSFEDGLFHSVDGGTSFQQRGESVLESASVTSIAISPSNPETILVGTEPSNLYRSDSGGDDWEHVTDFSSIGSRDEWSFPPRPETHHVRWIAFHPTNPNHWYIGIEAGAFLVTTDGGETWTDRPPGSRRDNHWMATHPAVPDRVYAAAGDGYAESLDGGHTWSHPQEGLSHRYVWSVAVDPGDPETRLVSAAKSARQAHWKASADAVIYRRTDQDEWQQITDDVLPTGNGVRRYVLTSGTEPGEFAVAGNEGVFISTDSGESWNSIPGTWDLEESEAPVRGVVVG